MSASVAPAEAPRARREWIVAAAAGIALTALFTDPTLRSIGHAGRVDTGDGRFSIWNVAWVAHALLEDQTHLYDANIFYPHSKTLTYSELNLVAGALATPVYAVTHNAIAAHNSAVVIALAGSFLAMWALTRGLTGSMAAGLVAATGYTFSAYTAAHTAEIQLLMIFGFPLVMLAFHRLAERPTVRTGAGLGAALGLTALASGYYGVFAGGLTAVAVLHWMRRAAAYWKAVGAAAVVLAVVILPALAPFVAARREAGASRPTNVDELRLYSANWRDYVTSGTLADEAGLRVLASVKRAVAPAARLPQAKEVLFPGVVVGALGVAGLVAGARIRSDRRLVLGYALVAALACWASFGPDAGLYRLVMWLVPGSSLLRAPSRLGIVVIFAASVLAAFGLRRLARARPWVGAASIAVLTAELWVPWPLKPMPTLPLAYQMLATLPRAAVVELPFPYIPSDFHQHTRAMLRSTANWQPLVNGYSDFTPDDFEPIAVPINGFPNDESFQILRRLDVRYVIVRASDYREDYRQRLLERFPPYARHLRRLTNDQDVWLYEIIAWP